MKLKDLTFLIAILTSVVFVVACGGGKDVDAPAVAVKEIVSTDILELTPVPDSGSTRESTSPSISMVLEMVSPELLMCVKTALGDEQYNGIITGEQDAVADQLGLVLPCIFQYPQEANVIMEMFGLDTETVMAVSTPIPNTKDPDQTSIPTPVLILTPTAEVTSDETPTIDILNYSSYTTSDILRWVTLSEAKMKNRSSSILTFIYPVGKMKIPEQPAGRHFNQHEIMLSQNEIETILSSVEAWFNTRPCLAGERHRDVKDEHLKEYRQWLEGGADASTMQAVCPDTRIVAMGITEHMRNDEPLTEFQNLLIHEHYHAFQQDLEDEGVCRSHSELTNANTPWMVEGAAHYFSTSLVEEINGSTEAHSKILETALESYDRNGPSLLEGGEPDKTGAAALRLMIEKGLLDEGSIMDGSLFHDCARELVFDNTSPEIERIRESWYQIEVRDTVFKFKAEALAP